ncbi:MAG: aldehyde ferredoxin oxidoreductase family protein [Desulfobacterales bacterium]|nr:aldehyde ferredoxin oxidoreductase family protein [Desulfobacterales bacterium]
MGKGFCGKILHIDLTSRRLDVEELSEEFYKKHLSGLGLGAKVLWDNINKGIHPLSPENVIGFTTGLLTDTGSLFSGRFMVVSKSPLSGGWGDSNCGGYFSPSLKRCGFDAIFFYGASDTPVYLYLDGKKIEILDASNLWGKDTIETERSLKQIHGKRSQVACIGPSGEKLSLISGVCNDGGRMAGRSGLGAVMGSKKLKAVVAAGKERVKVYSKENVLKINKEFLAKINKFDRLKPIITDKLFGAFGLFTRLTPFYPRQPAFFWGLALKKFGTPSLTAMCSEGGDSPIKNWGGTGYIDFPLKRAQKIGAEAVIKYEVKKYGCYSCPLKCGGIMKVKEGPYPIEEMHKPEYETICSFGGLLLNDDLFTIFKINDLVNRAGIDSISCGSSVAFAIECFENGILTEKDTGGLRLKWGNSESILKLTEMIINRKGIGDILADGVKVASQKIGRGSEKYAVHCGGVEAPMHDPKFDSGFGISYYCEPAPARHTVSANQYLDLQFLEKKFKRAKKVPLLTTKSDKFRYDNKGAGIAVNTFYKMLIDASGVCFFGTQIGGDFPICEWLNAVTGWDLSNDEYLVIGERIEQIRHSFNVRDGVNAIRDYKPNKRLYGDPPAKKGPAKNICLDINTLSNSYYDEMRWDVKTGKPDKEHLKNLGLDEIIEVLHRE